MYCVFAFLLAMLLSDGFSRYGQDFLCICVVSVLCYRCWSHPDPIADQIINAHGNCMVILLMITFWLSLMHSMWRANHSGSQAFLQACIWEKIVYSWYQTADILALGSQDSRIPGTCCKLTKNTETESNRNWLLVKSTPDKPNILGCQEMKINYLKDC